MDGAGDAHFPGALETCPPKTTAPPPTPCENLSSFFGENAVACKPDLARRPLWCRYPPWEQSDAAEGSQGRSVRGRRGARPRFCSELCRESVPLWHVTWPRKSPSVVSESCSPPPCLSACRPWHSGASGYVGGGAVLEDLHGEARRSSKPVPRPCGQDAAWGRFRFVVPPIGQAPLSIVEETSQAFIVKGGGVLEDSRQVPTRHS